METLTVILAAAGQGKRLGQGINKAFVKINGVPLLVWNLRQLAGMEFISKVIIVVGSAEVSFAKTLISAYQKEFCENLQLEFAVGGKERQDSVCNALRNITEDDGFVAVHDGARPFADRDVFIRTLKAAQVTGAAVAGVLAKDTIKFVDKQNEVLSTPDRSRLRIIQTPQIFRTQLLKLAYAKIQKEHLTVTDDASAVESLGVKVIVAEGSYENNKITTPEDLFWARIKLETKTGGDLMEKNICPFRVGTGFDVHQLIVGRKLILCGVEIPYEKGLLGHSDADVALHVLMDAMLGAVGLGDIGKHFPDTSEEYKDADSMVLLRKVRTLLLEKGWRVGNLDLTIIAEKPKLLPYREAMEQNLMRELELASDAVNVKATTTERLGFTGRGEGIAAQAAVTVYQI